ncbi:pyridoxamine 5'-phosphate oxidase family protein [Antrihabitans cavernicola]|uniref:Pyridoxamine 5'-phosphate oxidase family protein n=1 Tax=Antrihabitans cavernicola TaxID=2495913 RepID=A0A5A7SDT4_9NOCA|nr:pyridoxamine 5'-phosphate oxidase family protein [Spelaeibacter cavernicola]KAA0024310.1 pyridoxamine 5'-phosphate oxidase family protein [Spelaeibacter cavernicola]
MSPTAPSPTPLSSTPLSSTPRSTIKRGKDRAQSDRSALYAVLDAGLVCNLAVVIDGAPVVLPTAYGRVDDTLYLHGSTGALSLRTASTDEVSVSVTLLDGVVYARSVFHFSMNYRSAVVHGRPRVVTTDEERTIGLRAVVEHLAPGSWDYAREPNAKELAKTSVVALDLAEAAVKVRGGDPVDEPDDVVAGGVWAGVLPLRQSWGEPVAAADLDALDVPDHLRSRQVTTPGR